tara:strand:+ start:39680 stop:40711 length:1032 start_codon:yes stop_codon:yes gene_type:complete
MLFYIISSILVIISCLFSIFTFKKLNIVDKPDGIRKIHKGEMPLGGGFTLFICSVLVYFFLFNSNEVNPDLKSIFQVSLIVLILGLVDDIKPLLISVRLIIQILASWLVIIITDIYVKDLGDLFGLGNIYLGQLGIPLTIFMIVGMCNAFNMIDGMDGLVGFVALVASASLGIIAIYNGISHKVFFPSIALSIFLFFNLGLLGKRWKMFLGDSGAYWVGFILAWYLVALSQQDIALIKASTALWFVLLPLIDALSTFLSRLYSKKQIFSGDRSHIHHMLLDSGLEKWKVLLIFLIISVFSGTFGVISVFYEIKEYYQFYGFLTLWFFYFLLVKFPYSRRSSRR